MRVVFDTNVLIAAFATQGLCQALFEVCVRRHEVIVGTHILDEVDRKLGRKLKVPAATVSEIRAYLESHCTVERPVPVPSDACRDPKDLPILGIAAASRADCLVTGDRDLLVVKRYHETEILAPRQLYDALRRTA
ncbi:MAG: putative toxin-antitoxin system toxin component, PIN family [Elusimicrobia bacterium]|nr:putative toxin-antitoxin system toxin component, PIN family [Elusimicrobiota bacterium]